MTTDELLYRRGVFLANAWSDIPVEEFTLDKCVGPSSTKPRSDRMKITMPFPSFYGLNTFLTYRCWRYSLWHEAMHSKTPFTFFTSNEAAGIRAIMKVLEDERVETLGQSTWKGMEDEKRLIRGVIWSGTEEINEPVCSIGIFKLFVSKLVLGRFNGHVSSETERKIDEAVAYARTTISQLLISKTDSEIIEGLRSSAEHIAAILDISENLQHIPMIDESSMLSASTTGVVDEEIAKAMQNDFGIQKEDVERIIEGCEVTNLEWERTLEPLEGSEQRRVESGVLKGVVTPNFSIIKSVNVRQDLVNKLVADIRNWRFSWKEYLAKDGDELDEDILGPKPFIAEDKLEAKVRIAVLIDHSGSIWPFKSDYKEMTVILCQALQKVGIRYALFAFNQPLDLSEVVVWMIKDGSRPFDRMAVNRLQQIEADGETPLAEVYGMLLPVLTRWRIQKFITFTDGVPDNMAETSRAIKILQRKGIQMSAVSYRYFDTRHLPYDRFDMIRDLDELPKALIRLLVGG